MNLLFALSRCETASVAELAAALSVTSGAVSQTVDVLEEAGLITNTVNPADRRGRLITLTPRARAEVSQFELEYFDDLAPIFDALSTADVTELDRILDAIPPRKGEQ
jgi:DNA-binding MarR family transcriptional regulator